MTEEARTFYTTGKAGRMVAGRPVPLDDAGAPKVGTELSLTAAEAEYELLLGTITAEKPVEKPQAAAPEKRAKAAPADPASNGA